jgi:hypothetical protein
MRTNEIISEIQKLPIQKQILVIEKTIHFLRTKEDFHQIRQAADSLYSDYVSDKELIMFTDIDFEDFYEAK